MRIASNHTRSDATAAEAIEHAPLDPVAESAGSNVGVSTRREMMNMMARVAGGTAIATLPAAGIAGQSVASTTDRSAWDRAMIRWVRAKRIADDVVAAYDRAWMAVEAEAPQPEPFAHHFTASEHHRALLYSVDLEERLARYRRIAPVSVFPAEAAQRSIQEAQQIVERIKAFREARRIANDRHDHTRLEEAYESAIDELGDAESALMEAPAPDTTALLWKLERLWGEDVERGESGGSYCHEWMAALMADARRLLDRRA
jgi:hypothetical protein